MKKQFLASFFTSVAYGCDSRTYTKRRFVEILITKILIFFCQIGPAYLELFTFLG